MLSLRTAKDFNCNPNLGMAEFTTNSFRNEITGELFRQVVIVSK